MKHIGIIAEYNPFHNGHAYQIQKIKESFPGKKIIVVVSGNYVQRGEPSIFSKYIRTRSALIGGADIIFELPVLFSSASSEHFATSGILALAKTGVIDTICFGAENTDLDILYTIADILINEPLIYKEELKSNLSNGMSFPKARALALMKCCPKHDIKDIINKPNNILAIEYIKAIKKYNLPLTPYIIKRIGSEYNDISLNDSFCSANALRQTIYRSTVCRSNELYIDKYYNISAVRKYIPENVYSYLSSEKFANPIFFDDFLPFIQYKLITEKEKLIDYYEISDYLANRINSNSIFPSNIDDIVESLTGKHITKSRIRRNLLNILLNKSSELVDRAIGTNYVSYLQLLGFHKDCSPIIKEIQNNIDIPVINKVASAKRQLSGIAVNIFDHEILIDDLYRQIFNNKYGYTFPSDYEQSVIIEN